MDSQSSGRAWEDALDFIEAALSGNGPANLSSKESDSATLPMSSTATVVARGAAAVDVEPWDDDWQPQKEKQTPSKSNTEHFGSTAETVPSDQREIGATAVTVPADQMESSSDSGANGCTEDGYHIASSGMKAGDEDLLPGKLQRSCDESGESVEPVTTGAEPPLEARGETMTLASSSAKHRVHAMENQLRRGQDALSQLYMGLDNPKEADGQLQPQARLAAATAPSQPGLTRKHQDAACATDSTAYPLQHLGSESADLAACSDNLAAVSEEGKALSSNATAGSKNAFAATTCMLEKNPAATAMLRTGLQARVCTSVEASSRAGGRRLDDLGNLATEKKSLWVQVVSWQDDEIGRLAADTAMWRAQLRLKDHIDEPATCPPAVRELRQLHNEAVAQQELIEQLLQTPTAPTGLLQEMQQAQAENEPDEEGAAEDQLNVLQHALSQSGMSLTLNSKAFVSITTQSDPNTHMRDLLMRAQQGSMCRCAAHTAALDAICCAQFRDVASRCEQLLQESVRLRPTTMKEEYAIGQQQASEVERHSSTASLDCRWQPSDTAALCHDDGIPQRCTKRSARRSERSLVERSFDAYTLHETKNFAQSTTHV